MFRPQCCIWSYYTQLSREYDGVTVADIGKFEKVVVKARKAELDLNFLRNCKTFNVFPKFLCFQLLNTSGHDILPIRKCLLRSAITRRTREYKKLLLVKKQLSDISNIFNSVDFYILQKSVDYNVKKAVNKIVKTHTKKLKRLMRNTVLPFTGNETITNLSS